MPIIRAGSLPLAFALTLVAAEALARLAGWGGHWLEPDQVQRLIAGARSSVGIRQSAVQTRQTQGYARQALQARQQMRRSTAQLALFSNVYRDSVRLDGVVKDPLLFREALATLYAIVGSDYRYVPRDRTAYLAYLRRHDPVHWQDEPGGPGFWAVTRYDDCVTVNRDYERFSSSSVRRR